MDYRYFSLGEPQRAVAHQLYRTAAHLPLICPHGHVSPRLLADPDYAWGTPVDMLIIPDHYVFRMLYAQGIRLEALGIPRRDGASVETDHRRIWQTVCDHWYLFRGTPTGMWLRDELRSVFGIETRLDSSTAQGLYDALSEKLAAPEFRPRRLFERFRIEVLATTDAATDTLADHQALRDSGWAGRVIPTFRPDALMNLETEGWHAHIDRLSEVSGIAVEDYATFIEALENRRVFFKQMGAVATDHGAASAFTTRLSAQSAAAIFDRALHGEASDADARLFTGHMLVEMARMSAEDGLVMQLHAGSYRNHNPAIAAQFGRDMGADIPLHTEYTRDLKALLDAFGNDAGFRLVLFTLDESAYSRELAPLAGHYPALRLGPPWWFFDSLNGMRRYFDQVMETAGVYNTAGFNDDTRAFPSIPARHDLWRRAAADWTAGLLVRQIIDDADAEALIVDLAYGLAKKTYRLESERPEGI